MGEQPSIAARARAWLARLRPGGAASDGERRRHPALREAIDLVVTGTEPRLRGVSNYGRKLAPAVARMLEYFDACGAWLAAPVAVSAAAWSADPLVRTLFASPGELQELFSASKELRAFFQAHPECPEAYVGLGATRVERRTLGMALSGEVLQREVAQTLVSFADYRVFGACASEAELRRSVERRGFGFLIGEALEQIVEEQNCRLGLEHEQHMLDLKLKALEHKRGAADSLLGASGELDAQIGELRARAQRGRHTLGEARASLATLEDYVAHICDVLGRPERYMTQERVTLRVNRMNVKVESPDEPGDELTFSEVTIGRRPPRVVVLARYPRADLLPERDRFDEAQRLFGA
jgi:hypothetical protein